LFRDKFQEVLNLNSLKIKYVIAEDILDLTAKINKREINNDRVAASRVDSQSN